jgi:multiple sugar transport system permease protein
MRDGGKFAGLRNYYDVLINPLTQTMLVNTVRYLGWSFLLGFVAPLLLALILSGLRRLQLVARTLFFLPAVANAVVIALLWEQLYSTSGFMNALLGLLGIGPVKWLEEPGWAMFATVLAQSWSTLGVAGLIYLAGLSTIPESLYEEAELSGANLAERFRTVTWPHLKPLVGISFVGWLLTTARTSEHVLLLTAGGPGRSTYVLGLDIFNQAYVKIQFGYAMAEVWLLVALILVLALYQMRAVREGQLRVG